MRHGEGLRREPQTSTNRLSRFCRNLDVWWNSFHRTGGVFNDGESGKTTIDQTPVKNQGRVSFWSTSTILLLFRERRQIDGRKPFTYGSPRGESPSGLKGRKL